jgi:DNA polymerase V
MFALVDCNNFYASCERAFNPSLNNLPVVILSNNDGCVIARSNEAKLCGVKMGVPVFQIKDIVAKNNITVFSSNYALYGDISQRVMNILVGLAPEIEIYSIDEAFLNLKGFDFFDLSEYAVKIKHTVTKNTGIPVSVGIGPTKTLAKIANGIAKKQKNGICILNNESEILNTLENLKVNDIWGIGGRYTSLLNKNNIFTAMDFLNAPDNWVRKYLSVVGLRIKEELKGNSCLALQLVRPAKQSICTSRSFGTLVKDFETLNEAVATFASRCAEKVRKQNSIAKILMVFVHTNAFKINDKQYAANRIINLPMATSSSIELIHYSSIALKSIYKSGYRYKKAGVILTELTDENIIQTKMFDNVDREKHQKIMKAIDLLNNSLGKEKVKIAAQGNYKRWKLKQEKLSPNYTTNFENIINVNV